LHSNRTYRYGHLDGFPSPFVPFPFPFLFLSLSFCSLAALRFVAWLPSLSLSAFVALLSFFGNLFCYLQVTMCRLPLLAVPAFPSFPGLSFRCPPMAVLVIPVFLPLFGSYLRHLRMAVLCHSYSWCARCFTALSLGSTVAWTTPFLSLIQSPRPLGRLLPAWSGLRARTTRY